MKRLLLGLAIALISGAVAAQSFAPFGGRPGASTSGDITVGTSVISGGTTTRVLYDNAGVVGEYVISGTGSVCMTTSCSMTTPGIGAATGSSVVLTGAAPQVTLGVNTTTLGAIKMFGNTSGDATVQPAAVAGTSTVVTLPNASSTLPIFGQQITFAGPTAARTYTLPDAAATLTRTVASGAKALLTAAIASAACTAAQTDTATGALTTDVIVATFNGDPTAVTGYVPLTTGMLTIIVYPTADTFNAKVCNNTSASITPGAITLNWKVVR